MRSEIRVVKQNSMTAMRAALLHFPPVQTEQRSFCRKGMTYRSVLAAPSHTPKLGNQGVCKTLDLP